MIPQGVHSTASDDLTRPSVVVLYGPTAVGKTGLLSALPNNQFEIINADSRQVYRYLDIGTAKPDANVRATIPHHLIDICSPSEQFSAGRFVRESERFVREIHERGRCPIIAGGTAYYIRSFLYGLPEGPGACPEIRAQVKRETNHLGLAAMFDKLKAVDPVTASRIPPGDRYRTERALEVFRGTGKPLSSYHVPNTVRKGYRFFVVHMQRERQELYTRIGLRVDAMIAAGLKDEIVRALDLGYTPADPGLRTIGYSEILEMLADGCRTFGESVEIIKRNSRRYAKRQITFFKSLPADVRVEACDFNTIADRIAGFYKAKDM